MHPGCHVLAEAAHEPDRVFRRNSDKQRREAQLADDAGKLLSPARLLALKRDPEGMTDGRREYYIDYLLRHG